MHLRNRFLLISAVVGLLLGGMLPLTVSASAGGSVSGQGNTRFENGPVDSTTTYDSVEVSVLTRAPKSGELLTGSCFVIEAMLTNTAVSNEGCDENGDGQVDFKGIAPGQYMVHQTRATMGYPLMDDFSIIVIAEDAHQSFPAIQRKAQSDLKHRNVAIVLSIPGNGERLAGSDACVIIEGASKEGCDDNGDGQIDFLDVPTGVYKVKVTRLPAGYQTLPFISGSHQIHISDMDPVSIVTMYVAVSKS